MFALVKTLNKALGESALQVKTLEDVFNTYWPRFESRFKEALEKNPEDEYIPKRSPEDLLSEVLRTVRNIEYRQFTTARGRAIGSRQSIISRVTHPTVQQILNSMLDSGWSKEMISQSLKRSFPEVDIDKLIVDEELKESDALLDRLDDVDESKIDG